MWKATAFSKAIRLSSAADCLLGEARAGGEIGVGQMVLDPLHRSAQPYLPAQALPVKHQSTFRCSIQFSPFLAVQIRVEYESLLVESLQQNHPGIRQAV